MSWKQGIGCKNGRNKDNGGSGNRISAKPVTGAAKNNGNATNTKTSNSQNRRGILFPIDSEISAAEEYLISLIETVREREKLQRCQSDGMLPYIEANTE